MSHLQHCLQTLSRGVALTLCFAFISDLELSAQSLPPIEYDVHFICRADGSSDGYINAVSINANGEVIGNDASSGVSRGFLYKIPDANNPNGTFLDIADLINTSQLENDGWKPPFFMDINDHGAIVGYLDHVDGPSPRPRRGILIDTSQEPPTWEYLPDFGSYNSWGRRINNWGDIAGGYKKPDDENDVYVYNNGMYGSELAIQPTPLLTTGLATDINNAGTVLVRDRLVTSSEYVHFLYDIATGTFSDPLDLERDYYLTEFNDLGQASGHFTAIPSSGRGKNKTPYSPKKAIRLGTQTGPQLEWQLELDIRTAGEGINNHGVLVGYFGADRTDGFVYHDNWGFIDLDDLVVTANWNSLASLRANDIADTGSELDGFGVIIGSGALDISTATADWVAVPRLVDRGDFQNYTSGDINLEIPDNDPDGVSHTIQVDAGEAVQIVGLTVALDINHERAGDLTVTLTGPSGDVVTLNNTNGDNPVAAFNGISTEGPWKLKVVDSRHRKTGTIVRWTLSAEY